MVAIAPVAHERLTLTVLPMTDQASDIDWHGLYNSREKLGCYGVERASPRLI